MSRPRRAASVAISNYGAATLFISNGDTVYLSPNQTHELYITLGKYFGNFGIEPPFVPICVDLRLSAKKVNK